MSNNKLDQTPVSPFNSALESGLRAICILYEAYPEAIDAQRLVFFDYLVVHSGDVIDGPESLHPATPFRSNEWIVRKRLVDQGLKMLIAKGLVGAVPTKDGILYSVSDAAGSFITCLREEYTKELRSRARWTISKFGTTSETELVEFFNKNLDRWGAEFQIIGDWEEDI